MSLPLNETLIYDNPQVSHRLWLYQNQSNIRNLTTCIKDALVTKSYNLKTGIKHLDVPESHYQLSGSIKGVSYLNNF